MHFGGVRGRRNYDQQMFRFALSGSNSRWAFELLEHVESQHEAISFA
jgi:hypothetical protein